MTSDLLEMHCPEAPPLRVAPSRPTAPTAPARPPRPAARPADAAAAAHQRRTAAGWVARRTYWVAVDGDRSLTALVAEGAGDYVALGHEWVLVGHAGRVDVTTLYTRAPRPLPMPDLDTLRAAAVECAADDEGAA